MTTRKPMHLSCPVETDGEPCEADIKVWAYPGHPGSRDEPPSGGEIEDVESTCGHQDALLSGAHDEKLWDQIEVQMEHAYEDAQEARAEHERERWYGDGS